MNIALLIAGGSGNRMGQDIPKQFMHVDGAPIIIRTMQCFQQHPDISAIAVVCLKGWETVLQSYANQFMIDKLKWIFPGGDSGMESIHNGIYGLKEKGCDDEDLVLIHDGVRPLLSQEIISSNIAICKAYGYANPMPGSYIGKWGWFYFDYKYSTRYSYSYPNSTNISIEKYH